MDIKQEQRVYTKEIRDALEQENPDTPVHDAWFKMAESWLRDDASGYARYGFIGLNGRSPDEVILDFYMNDQLTDKLTDQEIDNIFATGYIGDAPTKTIK